jgi:hypothetical protein
VVAEGRRNGVDVGGAENVFHRPAGAPVVDADPRFDLLEGGEGVIEEEALDLVWSMRIRSPNVTSGS